MEELGGFEEQKGVEIRKKRPPMTWLLDIETSGLDWETQNIIAMWLVGLDRWETVEERIIFIRPEKPLTRLGEQVTGISNQELEKGITLRKALTELNRLPGHIFIWDRRSVFPFLRRAYGRCNRRFPHESIRMLDDMLDAMGIPAGQPLNKLFQVLPMPPDGAMPNVPPQKMSTW